MSSPKLVCLPPEAQPSVWSRCGCPWELPDLHQHLPCPLLSDPMVCRGSSSLLLPAHPPTLSLPASHPLCSTCSLSSLCVQTSRKALTAPRAVTQTVKNVYVLVVFHFCVLILHTQAHALTHGVPGASVGCWPREPSQSKGIWALLEKAGKEERKIKKQKRIWREAAPPACAPAPAVDGARESCIDGGLPGCACPSTPAMSLSPAQHSP